MVGLDPPEVLGGHGRPLDQGRVEDVVLDAVVVEDLVRVAVPVAGQRGDPGPVGRVDLPDGSGQRAATEAEAAVDRQEVGGVGSGHGRGLPRAVLTKATIATAA